MQSADYVLAWTTAASAPGWVLHNLYPFLLAAAVVRIITFIYRPHS